MTIARILLAFALLAGCHDGVRDAPPLRLTVMSFNTYGAGSNDGKSIDETVAAIRTVDPDIVVLLEVRAESDPCTAACPATGPSRAPAIAAALGYSFYEQQQQNEALWANAILSRYPIAASTGNDLGVVIHVAGRRVAMFGIHLTDYPYQPYQLLGIEYNGAPFLDTAEAAIAAATAARGPGLELLLADLASLADVDAVFVGGDFNEPSHRDWSEQAAAIGRHPAAVQFPTVRRLESIGFIDTFRAAFPDEIEKPGYTWTPLTSADAADDHHDRIDYILVRAAGARIESAAVVGEQRPQADIVVTPWPSDHRAVVTTVSIP
ncbi:MAG: endonuclease/exonuclease/phosphatase family protein [Gammaproteobacteria bacterium]|nr:endonuclease/exonuclease/phosphatase family protein [Gammaproteobacteria bacterium]MDH5303717.1 endonuclease/exonuclease/phosphatase family protein [Gammaproteobacteria bacterium]MDH5322701.1 endonuclease/exonuclease/phosphatase family protein [Gammaproteobacteria bacterium]